jgi:hypothetical protein
MPHAHIDWPAIGQALSNYWTFGAGFLAFCAWFFRSPIARRWRTTINALRSAHEQSVKIEHLGNQLIEERAAKDDWRDRFTEMQQRYDAIHSEFERLGSDMAEFAKRMTTAEDLVRMLHRDRDKLIDLARSLVGQIVISGGAPANKMPLLESIIAVPGPPETPPTIPPTIK